MSKWIGYAVSVNCGEPLGCYQGTILEADGTTITLTKAFRNGFPYPKSQVTLNAADIKDLKIIDGEPELGGRSHSTVALGAKNKKTPRATVCETLQAARAHTGPPSPGTRGAAPPRPGRAEHAGSLRPRGGGGGGQERARRRNEACFGAAAEPALADDFDFEGNLALFDRAALREEMRGARPDLLRQAEPANLRPDECVLAGAGAAPGVALRLPAELRGAGEYVTDRGARLPAAAPRLRRRLWAGLARLGVAEFSEALLARAAADVALRLAGGGRRLEARNAHQAPAVACVAGAHRAGAAALHAARLLAAHGARAAALVAAGGGAGVERARAAAALGDVALAAAPAELPAAPDVVLLALHDPEGGAAGEGGAWHEAALAWARGARGAVVSVEPPAGGAGWEGVRGRAAVLALVPGWVPAWLGRCYLANVCPPARLFSERGLEYRPPFGAEALLALHPADD